MSTIKRTVVAVACAALTLTGLTGCGGEADANVAACAAYSEAMSDFNDAMDDGPHDGPPSADQTAAYDAMIKSVTDAVDSTTGNVHDAFKLHAQIDADSGATENDIAGIGQVLGVACINAGADVT